MYDTKDLTYKEWNEVLKAVEKHLVVLTEVYKANVGVSANRVLMGYFEINFTLRDRWGNVFYTYSVITKNRTKDEVLKLIDVNMKMIASVVE